jgi:hypothetical protein
VPISLVASRPVSSGRPRVARACPVYHLGVRNRTSSAAVEFTLRTGPQTTGAITPAIALGISVQRAARIGGKTSPESPSEISRQVAVGFAPQTGCPTGMKLDYGKPCGVALDITPGTVLGTVPTAVPEMSILTAFTAPNAGTFGYLGWSKFAWHHQSSFRAYPVGFSVRKVATFGVPD